MMFLAWRYSMPRSISYANHQISFSVHLFLDGFVVFHLMVQVSALSVFHEDVQVVIFYEGVIVPVSMLEKEKLGIT